MDLESPQRTLSCSSLPRRTEETLPVPDSRPGRSTHVSFQHRHSKRTSAEAEREERNGTTLGC